MEVVSLVDHLLVHNNLRDHSLVGHCLSLVDHSQEDHSMVDLTLVDHSLLDPTLVDNSHVDHSPVDPSLVYHSHVYHSLYLVWASQACGQMLGRMFCGLALLLIPWLPYGVSLLQQILLPHQVSPAHFGQAPRY